MVAIANGIENKRIDIPSIKKDSFKLLFFFIRLIYNKIVLLSGKNIFKINEKSGKSNVKIHAKSGKNVDYFSKLC